MPWAPSHMRGYQGSWSPGNVVGTWRFLSGQGLSRPFPMRGREGSWSPPYVVGPCSGPQCSGPFQAQNRGPCRAQLRMPGVREQAPGRVGFVGAVLKDRTSLRSLGRPRVGSGGIEAPRAFAVVWPPCVRVPGGKASGNRGPGKPGPSTYA